MSELYSIQDTTLTALGDAVRSKVIGQSELPITIIPEQFIQYNKTYPFEFPTFVKKIKITGTGRYTMVWDGNANGYQGVGIAPGKYTSEHETRRAEGYTVAYTFDMDTLYDEKYFDFEAMVEGNSFTLVASKASSNSTNYYLTYTAIGLDENGNEFKYTPLEMVDVMNGLEIPDIQPIVLTGTQSNACGGAIAGTYIEWFGDTISTDKISSASNMFANSTLTTIPFSLNFDGNMNNISSLFNYAGNLTTVPEINYVEPYQLDAMFRGCYRLREIPENLCDNWDWSYIQGLTSQYSGSHSNVFSYCYSLRRFPIDIYKYGNPNINPIYNIYYDSFENCVSLDEIVNLPFPHYKSAWTSNAFTSTFSECYRLKRLTFALQEDGSPYVMNWKNQTISLDNQIGYCMSFYKNKILDYNSGITADKEVKDDATYQALKNDPDWFSCDVNYSRYNHDSAVNTINSLPDCSASGGTNTIKFMGASGALTDGGAINTLTEEEIAVATAKGWVVSYV